MIIKLLLAGETNAEMHLREPVLKYIASETKI